MKDKELKTVSVVIPVYNEEKYIHKLIKSIKQQDYDFTNIEVIFVNGNSEDKTVELIKNDLKDSNIDFKIIENEKRLTPISVNLGIKNSKNDIIIRLDAHSEYPKNYITKCVYYLNKTGADNVGCTIKTIDDSNKIGKAISNVLSSKFGVGNSEFRTNGKSGYVDTVPYGTFKRELFEKIGYFNEELPRSEDNEFNHRIIENGGRVYLFDDISVKYHPRNKISKLMNMGIENGKWGMYTSYIIPGTMKLRHFIPLLFVLGIIAGIMLIICKIKWTTRIFLATIILYFTIDFMYTVYYIVIDGLSQIICFIVYPLFHISYGIGSIFGIGKIIKKKIIN